MAGRDGQEKRPARGSEQGEAPSEIPILGLGGMGKGQLSAANDLLFAARGSYEDFVIAGSAAVTADDVDGDAPGQTVARAVSWLRRVLPSGIIPLVRTGPAYTVVTKIAATSPGVVHELARILVR